MATITPKCLFDGALTGSTADLYTVAANTRAVIKSVTLCNDTGAPVNVTILLNPRTAGTDRTVIDNKALADEQTYTAPELINQVIEAGGKVRGVGAGVDVYISGVEIVG